MNFTKIEDGRLAHYGVDGAVVITSTKQDVTLVFFSGQSTRKVSVINTNNVGEAIRDSLDLVRTFCKTSKTLSALKADIEKKCWPTLDGKPLVPTFYNVDVEDMNLSHRALNALEKNNIFILGKIPDDVEEIKALRSVGAGVATEIDEARKKYLQSVGVGPSRKKKLKIKSTKKAPTKAKIKPKVVSKGTKTLIAMSNIPTNIQELLFQNAFIFVEDIPKDIEKLQVLKKFGPSKAHKLLQILKG